MGDFDQLSRRVTALSHSLSGAALREITTQVAVEAKKDVGREAVADVGSDLRMSGWGRFRFGSGFELVNDHQALLAPRPNGAWSVLDGGRKRGHKMSRRAGRNVGWGPTRGKHTWQRARAAIEKATPGRVHKHVHAALARIFRGD